MNNLTPEQLAFRAGYEQGRFDAQVETAQQRHISYVCPQCHWSLDKQPAQQQEPVAWRYKKEGGGWFVSDNEPQYVEQWNDIEEIQPLYTSPPASKPLFTQTDVQEAILAEREACAKVCDEEGLLWGQRYAAAIRARGQA